MGMQKIIVIVGPTASGKSALAVALAKKFDGEVISADSRQVYRGLEIGSGAITKKEMRGIRHHLLGISSPRRAFTAAQFVAAARRAIADIARRGKISIIAGGTAFWIDALVHGLSLPEVKPNARLRRALAKKSAAQLLAILQKYDPRRAAEIEQKNPRRLIRAIEIARSLGAVPRLRRQSAYDALWIGLTPSYEAKPRRIEGRVCAMMRRGLLAETKKLLREGVSEKRIREFGFAYAVVLDAIAGKISRAELAPRIIRDTQKYARRQMRWWRSSPAIRWIGRNARAESARLVRKFLRRSPQSSARSRTTPRARSPAHPAPPRRLPRRDF